MSNGCQQSLMNHYARIEAILFACGEPVALAKLADILGISISACRQQIDELSVMNDDSQRGVALLVLDDCVQMVTKERYSNDVKQALAQNRNASITSAAMEVLSIIAYNQPVTRGFIEQVRGVNSNYIVNNLLEKGLIEEAGRMDLPGRPISYRTTKLFLRSFGISSLAQLPPVEMQEYEEQTKIEPIDEDELSEEAEEST